MRKQSHKHLVILGTRGIPAQHGGFETFAQDLSHHLYRHDWNITVYCQSNSETSDIFYTDYDGIQCIHISPYIKGRMFHGAWGTAIYDARCYLHAIRHYTKSIWLTLGYNTGTLAILPFLYRCKHIMHMDGIEWKRGKWSWFYKLSFKMNYALGGLCATHLIADHPEIYTLLSRFFFWKKTKIHTIAYSSRVVERSDISILDTLHLQKRLYALVVARPEPENNIELIVKAWVSKKRAYPLVILGNYTVEHPYHASIIRQSDETIFFPGAIHEKNSIDSLRFHASFYIHGHTVGGTNPSLVEALGAGNAVIAHDNAFNRGVSGSAAQYFKNTDDLAYILDRIFDAQTDLNPYRMEARRIHHERYQESYIMNQYQLLLESLI